MLDRLAKNHAGWLRMANDICGDLDVAKDLVQDMYIKLHDSQKDLNPSYVYLTIKSIFIDQKRKNKEIPFSQQDLNSSISNEDNHNVSTTNIFDLVADKEQEQIEMCNRIELDKDYVTVKSVFDSLPFHQKEVIRWSYLEGVRKFSRDSKIYVWYISKTRKEFKEKVWQELKSKTRKQQDLETLLNTSLPQLVSNPAKVAISEEIFLM